MKKLFTLILSWLLHQANRESSSKEFYAVKNKILKKYGWHIGYDVQFITAAALCAGLVCEFTRRNRNCVKCMLTAVREASTAGQHALKARLPLNRNGAQRNCGSTVGYIRSTLIPNFKI